MTAGMNISQVYSYFTGEICLVKDQYIHIQGLKEFLSPMFSIIVVWALIQPEAEFMFVKGSEEGGSSKNLRSLDKNKKNVPRPDVWALTNSLYRLVNTLRWKRSQLWPLTLYTRCQHVRPGSCSHFSNAVARKWGVSLRRTAHCMWLTGSTVSQCLFDVLICFLRKSLHCLPQPHLLCVPDLVFQQIQPGWTW